MYRNVVEVNMVVISTALGTRVPVKGKITCAWVTRLEILPFIWDSAKNLTIRDISKCDRFIRNHICWILEQKNPVRFSLRREYPPLSLHMLQMIIDTNRLDISKPVDLVSLINTGVYHINVHWKHAGVHLTDEVMSCDFTIWILQFRFFDYVAELFNCNILCSLRA